MTTVSNWFSPCLRFSSYEIDNNAYLLGLEWRFKEMLHVEGLAQVVCNK